ncbi:MAG: hypothetical protein JNK04_19340, partial [Myxococcales bacterium]|nr:hypothetical protein [Myxococcales bacterium]
MDDDDPIGGGTLVMTPQASPPGDARPGSNPGNARLVPTPIAVPGEPDRRVPRPPIFQVAPVKDPEDTSVDEVPTRLVHDSASGAQAGAPPEAAPRNLHPAFAQTQLQPFGPPPPATSEASGAPPRPWPEPAPAPAGYPAPPVPTGLPLSPGATTLQGLGEAERIQVGGYPQAPFP